MTSMWTPDRAAFAQVGVQMATQADSPALPTFLRDAYAEYAATRLS